jgi:DNA-binding response OmpR family regulator
MSLRVLIADDDPVTVSLVAATITRIGYEVTLADDGDSLLQKVAEDGPFEVIVTDVAMPWMSGLQVASSLRAAGLRTPILVMTALPLDPNVVRRLGDGAVLLRKPFHLKELVAAVQHLVRLSHHRDPIVSA